jgi:hypothetical protein
MRWWGAAKSFYKTNQADCLSTAGLFRIFKRSSKPTTADWKKAATFGYTAAGLWLCFRETHLAIELLNRRSKAAGGGAFLRGLAAICLYKCLSE